MENSTSLIETFTVGEKAELINQLKSQIACQVACLQQTEYLKAQLKNKSMRYQVQVDQLKKKQYGVLRDNINQQYLKRELQKQFQQKSGSMEFVRKRTEKLISQHQIKVSEVRQKKGRIQLLMEEQREMKEKQMWWLYCLEQTKNDISRQNKKIQSHLPYIEKKEEIIKNMKKTKDFYLSKLSETNNLSEDIKKKLEYQDQCRIEKQIKIKKIQDQLRHLNQQNQNLLIEVIRITNTILSEQQLNQDLINKQKTLKRTLSKLIHEQQAMIKKKEQLTIKQQEKTNQKQKFGLRWNHFRLKAYVQISYAQNFIQYC